MKHTRSPEWAVTYAEAQAYARLRHERALNSLIASRNPQLAATERYRRGPLPPWHPRFGTRAAYLEYLARREMGRFDPEVSYPIPEGEVRR